MNNEKYNQIIDEAYPNYQKKFKELYYHTAQMGKEEFINKVKSDSEFSKKWGLKIEERELSREERIDLYAKEYTPGMRNKYEKPFDDFIDAKLKIRNIPTKLIMVTYNNETIESYE